VFKKHWLGMQNIRSGFGDILGEKIYGVNYCTP
jgi:hypothetical protein